MIDRLLMEGLLIVLESIWMLWVTYMIFKIKTELEKAVEKQ
jgi:hypothetical protein